MNLKPIFVLVIIICLILQLRNCNYGAEHQKVDAKYKNAHLTAVSAQNLLKEKKPQEALKYYEMARAEMEHPDVGADKGEDIYINYGFVMNDIGVIHLSFALYGNDLEAESLQVNLAKIDRGQLAIATAALHTAIDFYQRWFKNNPSDYERFSKAISESYANIGVAFKYADKLDEAQEAFRLALLYNPDNGNAERSLTMLEINPKPYIDAGKLEREKY